MIRPKIDKSRWGTPLVSTRIAEKLLNTPPGTKGILLGESGSVVYVITEGNTVRGVYAKEFWQIKRW